MGQRLLVGIARLHEGGHRRRPYSATCAWRQGHRAEPTPRVQALQRFAARPRAVWLWLPLAHDRVPARLMRPGGRGLHSPAREAKRPGCVVGFAGRRHARGRSGHRAAAGRGYGMVCRLPPVRQEPRAVGRVAGAHHTSQPQAPADAGRVDSAGLRHTGARPRLCREHGTGT